MITHRLAVLVRQVPAKHLIAAAIMSVPAALTVSKLLMPETEKSHTTTEDVECMPHRSVKLCCYVVRDRAEVSEAMLLCSYRQGGGQ